MANNKQKYTKQELMQLAYDTAIKYGVAPEVVMGIIDRETGGSWNPNSKNYSKIERSQGLMQINIDAHPDYKGGYDPVQNIDYGTRFLQRLLKMYGGDYSKAVAAYNGSGSKAREYSKDVLLNRATKFDKNTMNTLAKNSGVSPTSSQGLMAKMQGGTTGAAAQVSDGQQIALPRVDQQLGIQTNPNQMYNTMTDLQTGKDNVYDAYGTFGNKPIPTSAQELLSKSYGAGVQDYKNAYDTQIKNLDKAYENIQNTRATNDQELLAKFKAMREIAAQDPRLQNGGYYINPRDIDSYYKHQALANLASAQTGSTVKTGMPDPMERARLMYEAQIANQYGVPYQEYLESRLQNMSNNLGISQGEIQYMANRAAAGDTLAQQWLQSLNTAGTNYMSGLSNAGKLDAENAKEAIKLILSGDNELRKVGMEALVKLYPDMQDRVKEILNTELTQQGGITQEGIKADSAQNVAGINQQGQLDVANVYKTPEMMKLDEEKAKLQSQTNLNNATAYYNLLISQGMTHEQALAHIYGGTQNNTPAPTPTPTQANPQIQPNLVRDNDGNAVNPVNTQAPAPTNTNNQGNNIWNNVIGIGANLIRYGIPGIGGANFTYDTVNNILDQAQQRGWIGGNN